MDILTTENIQTISELETISTEKETESVLLCEQGGELFKIGFDRLKEEKADEEKADSVTYYSPNVGQVDFDELTNLLGLTDSDDFLHGKEKDSDKIIYRSCIGSFGASAVSLLSISCNSRRVQSIKVEGVHGSYWYNENACNDVYITKLRLAIL